MGRAPLPVVICVRWSTTLASDLVVPDVFAMVFIKQASSDRWKHDSVVQGRGGGFLGALLFRVLEDSVVTLLSVVGQVGASQVVSFGIGRGVTRVLFKSGAFFF